MTAKHVNLWNGYIGMYTDYGITEIGNKEEDDTEEYTHATHNLESRLPLLSLIDTQAPTPKCTKIILGQLVL